MEAATHIICPNYILLPSIVRGQMVHSGPLDRSVLIYKEDHRSEDVWKGVTRGDKVLSCREHLFSLTRNWVVDVRMLSYVKQAGFYGVHRLRCSVGLDRPLITALVERWRQETHTFHLAVGEATITLGDVVVLLGLRVHGDAVIGSTSQKWSALVEELLGVMPGVDDTTQKPALKGSALRLSWLRKNFSNLSPDADDLTVQRFARAYILMLMGSVLFADKSGDAVQLIYLPLLTDLHTAGNYSWGSAMLAFLYRQLCRACRREVKEIGGPLLLLQLWSWEHIHIGVPAISQLRQADNNPPEQQPEDVTDPQILGSQHMKGIDPLTCSWLRVYFTRVESASGGLSYYRDALDHQSDDQMTWQPYTEDILALLPEICRSDTHVWRTYSPLIRFDIVEYHLPDRVMQQFGFDQTIPLSCNTSESLHRIDRRGAKNKNYVKIHAKYLEEWNKREDRVVGGTLAMGQTTTLDAYLAWYRTITNLIITPPDQERPSTKYQPASNEFVLSQTVAEVLRTCTRVEDSTSDLPVDKALELALHTLQSLASSCTETLHTVGKAYMLHDVGVTTQSTSSLGILASRPPRHIPNSPTPSPTNTSTAVTPTTAAATSTTTPAATST